MNPHPFLAGPAKLAFAHRGGAASQTENTIEAFSRAVTLGYRYLETDVQVTADRVPVLFHDRTLRRMAGRARPITTFTWRDLATIRLGGAAVVPRLDDVLAAWPQLRFNLDIKVDLAATPAVQTVGRVNAGHRVLLASFSDRRLARLRRLAGPSVATSLGRSAVARLRLASLTGTPVRLPDSVVAAQVPAQAFGVPVVDRTFVRYVHRLGRQVHVWTIDDPAHMHRLLDLGVDGIMTDRVDVLRDVFRHRGYWS